MLLQGGSLSCLPLAPHPHGAEAWLLGAEKELRQAGRQAEEPGLLACLFLGTCALSTSQDTGNKSC